MVVSTARKILTGSTDRGGARAAPLYTPYIVQVHCRYIRIILYICIIRNWCSEDTNVSYITQRTGVLFCPCQCVCSVYVSTYNSVHVCTYVCVCVCGVYDCNSPPMPLPSSPHPFLPSFPLCTNKCIIHIDTYGTPHVYCLLHEASPMPCSVLRGCCTLCVCWCLLSYSHAEHLHFCRPKHLRAREECVCIYSRMARWEFI